MANQQLGFDVVGKSNASQVMGQAAKEAEKLRKKLDKAFDIKGALVNSFIGAFGAAALLDKAISTISDHLKETVQDMVMISKESQKAGISAQDFDKLSVAAALSNTSMQTLGKSIRELKQFMKDAQTDTVKMERLTKGLGFTEDEVRKGKIDMIEAYKRVSQVVSKQEGDVNRLAYATAFFTTTGQDMLPLLDKISKSPDVFDGLATSAENSYSRLDGVSERLYKIFHNIKRITGSAIVSAIDFNEQTGGQFIKDPVTGLPIGTIIAAATAEQKPQPQKALDDKTNAKAIGDTLGKGKNDNTIANSLGASMGNGPTSGVIGVGNNATNLIMEEQLDTLKQIKEAIDRLGTPGYMNTDFTKQQYPTV
jgi:hypothetical protein